MLSEESKKRLEEIKTTQYGKALQEFLDEQFEILNDVQTCKTWDEVLGRKYALQTLESLFVFMREKKVIERIKGQYE